MARLLAWRVRRPDRETPRVLEPPGSAACRGY